MIEDSLNPIYYDTIDVMYDMENLENAPPIVLNVWDHDSAIISDTADFLGRAVIYLQDASSNLEFGDDEAKCNEVPKPKWHDVRIGYDDSTPACGQVLVSFIVATDDFEFTTPQNYMKLEQFVPTKEYDLEINVLGMR